MKKNNLPYDFSIPTRQSYIAILIITYNLYKVLIRQLIPIIAIILIQGKLNKASWFLITIISVASLGAIYSLVAFFKYFFFINDQKLVVRKGVFKKSTVEIPFERIQSVNYEQNLIHRIFNVVKINIDTAGSVGNELQLNALDHKLAQQLSSHILESKKEIVSADITEVIKEPVKEKIFHLSIPQLLKVGATENHLRSGAIIIFFFFYIYDSLEEVGLDVSEKGEEYLPVAQEIAQSLMIVAALIILFAVAAFVISLVRTILRYFDLTMFRKGEGFVIVSGLFNKKERAAKDEKIQLLKWSQNLLQRATGIFELVMKQASSAEMSDAKSFRVIGLSNTDIDKAQSYIFGEQSDAIETIDLEKVNSYYLFRRLYYTSLFFSGILLIEYLAEQHHLIFYTVIFLIIAIWACILNYRKKTFGVDHHLLKLNGGTFGLASTILSLHKVQNVSIGESFFQRRRKLSSLTIHTASGSIVIPDIPRNSALNLSDYLLYKVEKSTEKWM